MNRNTTAILFSLKAYALAALFCFAIIATPVYAEESAAPPAQLTKLPELLEFVEAEYPATAQAQGIEGEVKLAITLDETGAVASVELLESAGHGFDEAALQAAKSFRFSPATMGEEPVAVVITYTYRFTLKQERVKIAEAVESEEAATGTTQIHPVNLSGMVLERGTRSQLPFVEVVLSEDETFTAQTDESGRFELRGVPVGVHTLKFALLDYYVSELEVEIAEGERTDVTVYLQRLSYSEFSVTVRAKRPQNTVTRHVLQQEEIKTIPGTQGDALKVVEVLPGVARTPGGLGGLLIFRGADSESSRVFVDSLDVPILFHFGGVRSIINSDLIESIDFYPGNFGVKYGNTIGGIIDVKTKAPKDDRLHFKLDVNNFEAGFLFEGPIVEDLSFAFAFHRSYYDIMLKLVWPEDGVANFVSAPRYYDYQTKLHWKANSEHSLELFWFGSMDKMEVIVGRDEESGLENGMKIYFHKWQLKHDWKISEDLKNSLQLAFLYAKVLNSFGVFFFMESTSYEFPLRSDMSYKINDRYELNFGLTGNYAYGLLKLDAPHLTRMGEESYNPANQQKRGGSVKIHDYNIGAYAELVAEVYKGLKLIPGVRADHYGYINRWSGDGRLTTRYEIWDWTAVKAGVGTYHAMPYYPFIVDDYGNRDLKPEWSIQYSAGVEQKIYEPLTLDITGFYIDFRDLAVTNSEITTDFEAVPYTNDGRGRSYGMEVLLKHQPIKYFSGWLSYTLSRSERKFPEKDWELFLMDQSHILAAVGMFYLPYDIQIGFRFRLVSGIPIQVITQRGGVDADSDQYMPDYRNSVKTRMPLTHSLDIRIDKKFVFNFMIWTLYLDVQNVYNYRNREAVFYKYDYSEYDYIKGLPILPALGTQIEF